MGFRAKVENMVKDNYCVYSHTNKSNGKVFIGMTGQKPEARWDNGRGYRWNVHFSKAIQRDGWDGFEHRVIKDHLTKDEANKLEVELISKYNTTDPALGYNTSLGGDGKGRVSEETKMKLSEIVKEQFKNPDRVKKQSEALTNYYRQDGAREKASRATVKYFETPGAREKASESMRRYNREHPESREKNRQLRLKYYREHPEATDYLKKKVVQCDSDGNVIKIWESAIEASRETGATRSGICRACQGKLKQHHGFVWSYA